MSKSIKCTNCGEDIDLKNALYRELKSDFDKDVKTEVNTQTKNLTKQVETLTKLMDKYMTEAGDAKASAIELELKLKNADKDAESTYKKALLEEKENFAIDANKDLDAKTKLIQERADLQVLEKVDIISQLQDQLSIAQQKVTQGSMQAQGESQELLIEEYLRQEFPLDNIEEIKKGALGADSVQVVNTRNASNIGTIYYESKRTKTFNNAWIEKFKKDMREKGADIGVIVSSARPTGFDRAGVIKGVWVCTLEEFKVISHTLREGIVKVASVLVSQENKGDKMALLYEYLIGNEFKLQVEAIIDGFSQLQEDLNSEKRSMTMIWNKREKQIQKVIDSTICMYGSIKGIGGSSIQNIPLLEL